MENLFEMANKLGEAIKESDAFKVYQAAQDKYDADENLQNLIGEFNLKKMAVMTEMQKEDKKDEAKIEQNQKEMREVYANILKCEAYTEFNESKSALESTVNQVYDIINFHVTGKEPGCSGSGCSSCSGCH